MSKLFTLLIQLFPKITTRLNVVLLLLFICNSLRFIRHECNKVRWLLKASTLIYKKKKENNICFDWFETAFHLKVVYFGLNCILICSNKFTSKATIYQKLILDSNGMDAVQWKCAINNLNVVFAKKSRTSFNQRNFSASGSRKLTYPTFWFIQITSIKK